MDYLPHRLVRKALNPELTFAALPAIGELRRHLDELEARAIVIGRTRGAAWQDIADALGITRQAAQARMKAYLRRFPGIDAAPDAQPAEANGAPG